MSKILMLECETTLREELRQGLGSQSCEVLPGEGLAAGINTALTFAPDLIVCDLSTHRDDGLALIQQLTSQPGMTDIPVILLIEARQQSQLRPGLREIDSWLIKPATWEAIATRMEACLAQRDANREYASSAKAQLQTMLEAVAGLTRIIDQKKVRLLNSAPDTCETHLQQAIASLQRRHEKGIFEHEVEFGALLDNIGIGIYRGTVDAQGRILRANPAMARLFGYSSLAEFMRAPITDYYENPDERRQFIEQIRCHHLARNKTLRMRRRDGEPIYVEVTSQGHFDSAGELTWVEGILIDVTEKKRAEQDLLTERDLLWNLMNQIPDQIYFKDKNSKFTRINAQQAKILGLAKPEDAIGKSDYDFFDHASQSFVDEQIIINSGHPLIGKTERMRTAAGDHRWVSSTKAPIFSHSGEVTGLVGITRDIHEMKLAEEALAQRVRLAALNAEVSDALTHEGTASDLLQACAEALAQHLDGALARVWTFNETEQSLEPRASAGPAVHAPDTAGRVPVGQGKIGRIAQEKKPCLANLAGDDPSIADPAWVAREGIVSFAGYPLLIEDRLVGVLALFSRHPLPLAAGSTLTVVAKSIAMGIERKRAEETLRKNEELFRLITENAADLILVLDRQGRRLYHSPSFERVLGYSAAEMEPLQPFDLIHPDDRAKALEAMESAFIAGQLARLEYRVRHRDGQWRHIESTASVIRALGGESEKMVIVARDITIRKQAVADLEIASRHAGMAEVASSVLHNVGNVLNSVNISANVIRDRARKYPVAEAAKVADLLETHTADLADFLTRDNRARQVVDFLKKLSQHMAAEQNALIEELKELSKNVDHIKDIVSMQQSYAKVSGVVEKVQVANLIEDALRMHASSLLRHDVHIAREYAPEVTEITIEKHKALQILVNLIHNAKNACDEAGRKDKELILRAYPGGAGVCIEVADNGVGIPPENMTKIFNHGFTTRKNGHGFGLHSGAVAATEMGGSLQAHSAGPGQGATFTLSLPLQPKEQTA
jgi:PAS domain S-box-containing protein